MKKEDLTDKAYQLELTRSILHQEAGATEAHYQEGGGYDDPDNVDPDRFTFTMRRKKGYRQHRLIWNQEKQRFDLLGVQYQTDLIETECRGQRRQMEKALRKAAKYARLHPKETAVMIPASEVSE